VDLGLPVAIHTRKAFPEVLDSIHKVGKERLRGVFHSFSGAVSDLKEIEKLGHFKLGIGGVITYKNAHLPEVIVHTDLKNIVLETDAPYLPPVPYRGRRNEPVYIWETAARIAAVYELPLDKTAEIIHETTHELFKL
jgi:TatD DNase family protein